MTGATDTSSTRQADLERARAYVENARRSNLERLPPEAELAEKIGVTRSRLRAVLKKLESEGLIWRHVGKGTYVGERSLAPDLGSLAEVVNPLEAIEARLVVEPQLAALAAVRASSRETRDMEDLVDRMEAVEEFEQWSHLDRTLHRLIAKAARNTLLLAVFDTVRGVAPPGMGGRVRTVFSHGPRRATNDEHRAFVTAIVERDPSRAEALMRAHLLAVREALFGDR